MAKKVQNSEVNVQAVSQESAIMVDEVTTPVEVEVTEVKTEDKPQESKINVAAIVATLPDVVTPKHLDTLFNLNDGGKTVRRHLRKKYAEATGHEHKAAWSWKRDDKVLAEIVGYFAARYTPIMAKAQ